MKREPDDFTSFGKLIVHAALATLLLAVWLITAWAIDAFLLARFPLEGISRIGFRLLELALYCSTCRVVYRLLFAADSKHENWWK
jgi:hypothetical protein